MAPVVDASDWPLFLLALVSAIAGYVIYVNVYRTSDGFMATLLAAVIFVIVKYLATEFTSYSAR